MVRDGLSVLPLSVDGPLCSRLDVVAVKLSTSLGSLVVASVYAPPDSGVDSALWTSLVGCVSDCDVLLLCGDFNAHSPPWGARRSNFQGRKLCSAVLDCSLTPLNDSLPTFLPASGPSGGNLDLVFISSSRVGVASVNVTDDTFGSDHFLVLGELGLTPRHARSTSNRFNIKNVDWVRFREGVDEGLLSLGLALDSCSDPAALYSEFFALITGALECCRAYRPSSLPGKRRPQPIWWSSECDAAVARRRDALKKNIACQTRDERAACRTIDGEVKRFLRRQKHLCFVAFCESIDPSLGMTRIWRTVKSMSSRVAGYRTGRGTDPDSPALEALREELVCPGVPPVEDPMLVDIDDSDPMDFPFTVREFSAALGSCNSRSAPGLDGVGYGVLLDLSERARELLLSLFNRMFSTSRFPPSWRDTLVSFVPKAGTDKFRPISLTSTLCETFERLVQKRLEFLAENSSWVPANQFGFRRGCSSLDCVSCVVTDVL